GPDFSSSDFMDSQVSNCGEVVGRAAAFPGRSVVLLLLARGSDHCGQSPAVHRIVPPSVWWAGLIAGHHRAWIPGEAIPLSRDLVSAFSEAPGDVAPDAAHGHAAHFPIGTVFTRCLGSVGFRSGRIDGPDRSTARSGRGFPRTRRGSRYSLRKRRQSGMRE